MVPQTRGGGRVGLLLAGVVGAGRRRGKHLRRGSLRDRWDGIVAARALGRGVAVRHGQGPGDFAVGAPQTPSDPAGSRRESRILEDNGAAGSENLVGRLATGQRRGTKGNPGRILDADAVAGASQKGSGSPLHGRRPLSDVDAVGGVRVAGIRVASATRRGAAECVQRPGRLGGLAVEWACFSRGVSRPAVLVSSLNCGLAPRDESANRSVWVEKSREVGG